MQNLSNPRKEAAAGKIVHTKKNKHDEGKTTRMNENTECKRGKSEGTRDPFYTSKNIFVHFKAPYKKRNKKIIINNKKWMNYPRLKSITCNLISLALSAALLFDASALLDKSSSFGFPVFSGGILPFGNSLSFRCALSLCFKVVS